MGSPKFGDSNIGKNAFKMQRFIWTFQFLNLKDVKLSLMCFLEIFLGVGALIYMYILH